MSSIAVSTPLENRDKWRLRLTATAAALLLAFAIFFLQRMPAAESLPSDHKLTARTINTLALYNLRAGPVMQYDGALGAGLRISVSTGRPTSQTRNNLTALKVQLPNVKGAHIQWQGVPSPNGRIAIRIANQRQSPDAGILLQATGTGHIPELNIRAVQTMLTAEIDIATQGGDQAPKAELKVGDSNINDPAIAFTPLQFEIPPGEWLNLTFDNPQALDASSFRLGALLNSGGAATALAVGHAQVGRLSGNLSYPRIQAVTDGVCAARPGKLLLTHLSPRPEDCKLASDPADDNLFTDTIDIEPDKVQLGLAGSGFVVANGRLKPAPFFSMLTGNPLLAAFMAALVAAVVRSVWRLWAGREM
jgi:hypothetical protein